MVTFQLCCSPEAECVRTRVRLRHAMSADPLATTKPRQILAFLCFSSEPQNRHLHSPHLTIDGENQAAVFAGISQSLHKEHCAQDVSVISSILFWKRTTLHAEIGTLFPKFTRESGIFVPFNHIIIKCLLSETDSAILKL